MKCRVTLAEAMAELAFLESELAKMAVSSGPVLYFKAWNRVRIWRLVGGYSIRVWGKADRRRLREWESTCQICGGPFTIEVPRWVQRVDQHHNFSLATCPEHRMTGKEVMRIRYAHRDERAAVFEEIKRAKLANSKNKDR